MVRIDHKVREVINHIKMAEAKKELGGRVIFEANLKGLSTWKRVVDNRVYEIQQKNKLNNTHIICVLF